MHRYDFLSVYEPAEAKEKVAMLCGKRQAYLSTDSFVSSFNSVKLVFTSDSSVVSAGIVMSYTAIRKERLLDSRSFL